MSEISDYINNLASEYPKDLEIASAGKSFEDQFIEGIRLESDGKLYLAGLPDNLRIKILVTGSLTTSQPLSASMVLYLLNYMLKNTSSDTQYLRETSIFYFFPVINVDSYEQASEDYADNSVFSVYLKNRRKNCDSK